MQIDNNLSTYNEENVIKKIQLKALHLLTVVLFIPVYNYFIYKDDTACDTLARRLYGVRRPASWAVCWLIPFCKNPYCFQKVNNY